MKKLSIAIVLVTASVTFANAQTTDETSKAKTEAVLENQIKVDTTVATPAAKEEDHSMDTMKMEPVEVKKEETAAEMKQKAREEKKAARKSSK